MKFRKKALAIATHRLVLWVIVVLPFILFSGCNSLFEDNPLVQNMENGIDSFNFSDFDTGSFTQSAMEGNTAIADIPVDMQKVFDSFLERVRMSQNLSYKRILSYTDQPPSSETTMETFLANSILMVAESSDKFAMENPAIETRLLFDGTRSFLINQDENSNVSVNLGKKEKRHLLGFLANDATLELISTETEDVNGVEYMVFNLTENSQIAKWYFNPDNNQLALRMFKENEMLYAIKYEDLAFDNPEVPEEVFTLDGSTTPFFSYDGAVSSETPEGETTEASPSTNSTESSTNSKPPSTSTTAPNGTPPSTALTTPPPATTTQPPATSTKPPATSTKPPATSTKPPATTSVNPQPDKGEDLSAYGPKTTTKKPASTPVAPTKPKPKEYSELTEDELGDPGTIKNYPHDALPLIFGYDATSSSDITKSEIRTITINGYLGGTASGAADYYENILSDSKNFSSEETYADDDSVYYTVRGMSKGWNVDIQIVDDSSTLRRSMRVILSR